MKILAVDDDPICLETLVHTAQALGHEVAGARDGAEAWQLLEAGEFRAVICDWRLPASDGVTICERLRRVERSYTYFILMTGAEIADDIHARAFSAGVDDFLSKQAGARELRARLAVAERVLRRINAREQLDAFVPICTHCKDVRDRNQDWQRIESYLTQRVGTQFSHGICPDCYERVMVPQLERIGVPREARGPASDDDTMRLELR